MRVDDRDHHPQLGIGAQPVTGARTDATYTLWNFRAANNRAFVGGYAASAAEPGRAVCITLARADHEWHVMETRDVKKPDACGV